LPAEPRFLLDENFSHWLGELLPRFEYAVQQVQRIAELGEPHPRIPSLRHKATDAQIADWCAEHDWILVTSDGTPIWSANRGRRSHVSTSVSFSMKRRALPDSARWRVAGTRPWASWEWRPVRTQLVSSTTGTRWWRSSARMDSRSSAEGSNPARGAGPTPSHPSNGLVTVISVLAFDMPFEATGAAIVQATADAGTGGPFSWR
jgi:hypothetical protein